MINTPIVRQDSQTPVTQNTSEDLFSNDANSKSSRSAQMQLIQVNQSNMTELRIQGIEEEQDPLKTIISLEDYLQHGHAAVKQFLSQIPAYSEKMEDSKRSISTDIGNLQLAEVSLADKEAKIRAVENRYDDLIQMTPSAQQGELQKVKERSLLTMQEELKGVKSSRDEKSDDIEEKQAKLREAEGALKSARQLMPELILDLNELVLKLNEVEV